MGEQGLLKALPEGQLERFGKVVRDDHGHLRLGEIEFGRLMKELLTQRLEKLGIKMTFIDKDLGYELRCADPIPFDAEYTRDLGYAAVKFLLSPEAEKYGAIISFVDGKMNPLPFDKMLDPKTGRMQNRKVNVDGEAYECACAYMIKLEREDFEDAKQLAKLAAVVKMTPEQFRDAFRLSCRHEVKFCQHTRRREISLPPFLFDESVGTNGFSASYSMKWRADETRVKLNYVHRRTWSCHPAPTLHPAGMLGRAAKIRAVRPARAALARHSQKSARRRQRHRHPPSRAGTASPKFST